MISPLAMERVPVHGFYTLTHRGVQPNMDQVNMDLFNSIFTHEGQFLIIENSATLMRYSGEYQASKPGTAVVKCGPYKAQKAAHGISRDIYITVFNVEGFTQREYKTGRFHNERHWDCSVSVSYSGIAMYLPEGSTNTDVGEIPTDIPVSALRTALARVSGH
jgi:hypothetical protein